MSVVFQRRTWVFDHIVIEESVPRSFHQQTAVENSAVENSPQNWKYLYLRNYDRLHRNSNNKFDVFDTTSSRKVSASNRDNTDNQRLARDCKISAKAGIILFPGVGHCRNCLDALLSTGCDAENCLRLQPVRLSLCVHVLLFPAFSAKSAIMPLLSIRYGCSNEPKSVDKF